MRYLFLDLDNTRLDHLGCYGYGRGTSPCIDSIASEGIRFDRYYTADAAWHPSRTSLITGKFGIHSSMKDHNVCASADDLFDQLRSAGIDTISISSAADPSDTAIESWLDRFGTSDNWFLFVHMTLNRAPEDFGNPFEDEPLADAWISETILAKHKQAMNPDFPFNLDKISSLGDIKKVIDEYDNSIRFIDNKISVLVDKLKHLGIWEDTAVIITSGHGRNLGELGIYYGHLTADESTSHIPLIIRWPGMKTGSDHGLHYNIDLTSTLCDMLEQPVIPGSDGISFAGVLRGIGDKGRDYLVVSQCACICQRAVRFEDYLYIRTYHDAYRLFPVEQLYDIINDPHELFDLSLLCPEKCNQAARLLLNWETEQMLSSDSEIDPMWMVIRSAIRRSDINSLAM